MKYNDIININNAKCKGFIFKDDSEFKASVKIGNEIRFNMGNYSNMIIKEGEIIAFIDKTFDTCKSIDRAKSILGINIPNSRFHNIQSTKNQLIVKVIEGSRNLEHFYGLEVEMFGEIKNMVELL